MADHLVLIYQFGKVGSTAIKTLLTAEGGFDVRHVHFMSDANRRLFQDFSAHHGRPTTGGAFDAYAETRRAMEAAQSVSIITGARDIVPLTLSNVVQNPEIWLGAGCELTAAAVAAEIEGALTAPRPHHYPSIYLNHFIRRWFDVELRALTGVDVLASPFPTERGYQIYRAGKTQALLIRHENMAAAPAALSAFLDREFNALPSANTGATKPLGAAYERAKRELRLAPEFLSTLQRFPWMQALYSDEERARSARRWSLEPAAP
ncbi:MAG: putative capsular polysaccharide synthesis family protein [Pseudomonadota bacterium]